MSSPFFQIDGFQDPASPGAFGIIDFHHDLMFLLTIIVIFVLWLVVQTIWKFYLPEVVGVDKRFQLISGLRQHNVPLEIVWTIVPALVLVVVAFPSFALLYSLDELVNPLFTLRTVGHQWYWSYEYAFFTSIGKHPGKLLGRVDFAAFQQADKDLNYVAPRPHLGRAEGLRRIHGGGWKFLWALSRFETFFESDGVTKPIWIHYTKLYDSNMILSNDLHSGEYRLLEVNRKVYLPFFVNIRGLITAADVLHSWAVPALGVKVDACPGRLNQVSINLLKFGVFYGQCSEICGTNHAFMPIVVKVMRIEQFLDWFRVFYFNYLI